MVHIPITTRVTVVGDVHGSVDDVCAVLQLNGLPAATNCYVFNGDVVDRGGGGVECVCVLAAFMMCGVSSSEFDAKSKTGGGGKRKSGGREEQGWLWINRGNHEARGNRVLECGGCGGRRSLIVVM